MKTIQVVFTKIAISQAEAMEKPSYAYNTDTDVEIGDLITAPEIRGKVQIVNILGNVYHFINKEGILFLERTHSADPDSTWPIKTINATVIKDES